MGTVNPPSGGLASSSNYFLYSGCEPIRDLSVTVAISETLISNIGFTLQLNALTPPNNPAGCSWQQFVVDVHGTGSATQIAGKTDYFNSSGDHVSYNELVTLPTSNIFGPGVPAGYKFNIALTNDGAGNILSVTFQVINPANQVLVSSAPISPLGAPTPITAFELNIVGAPGGKQSYLWSGAGTITYTASTPLTVINAHPSACTFADLGTAEQANSVYGALDAGPFPPGNSIVQTFGVVDPGAYQAGGPFAVSQQIGANQTNLYAIDRTGQPVVFFVQGGGHWNSTLPLGPTGFARRGACIAASQQFGAGNQTDIFVVSQQGNLNVFWVGGEGAWNGPLNLDPTNANPAHSGGYIAVSQQFGAPEQTDAFLVSSAGQLNVYWVRSGGAWGGPTILGAAKSLPEGAPLAAIQQFGATNQTDVFVVDETGTLNVFWVQGTEGWGGPQTIGKTGAFPKNAHVAASQQYGMANQTDVFLVDNSGQLNVFFVEGAGGWSEAVPIGPAGLAVPGAPVAVSQRFGVNDQTDVFVVDTEGTVNLFSVQGAGQWTGPVKISPAGLAPTKEEKASGAFLLASPQYGCAGQTDLFVINQTGTNAPGWPMALWAEGGGGWNGPKALVTEI